MSLVRLPYCYKCADDVTMMSTGDTSRTCVRCGKSPCTYELWLATVDPAFIEALQEQVEHVMEEPTGTGIVYGRKVQGDAPRRAWEAIRAIAARNPDRAE